ncbi:hypothetical protein GCM10027162_13940 [Streptomyces incanus]
MAGEDGDAPAFADPDDPVGAGRSEDVPGTGLSQDRDLVMEYEESCLTVRRAAGCFVGAG